jgi:hypothetical protein
MFMMMMMMMIVSRLEIRKKVEYSEDVKICGISGFRREVDENCRLLGYYSVSSGNFLPTFWDNLSVASSWFKNPKRESVALARGLCREECVR